MRLDSHQHFWKYDPAQYGWIKSDWPLRRDFLPSDLRLLQQRSFDGSIAVQARQSLEESRWLLALADEFPLIKGVVGWVDLRSDRVEESLSALAVHPRFVGVRHVVQDEPDEQFMLQPDFLRGIGKLKQFNLTYDILTDWPVCLLAGSYERVFQVMEDYAQQLGADGRARFFGENAAHFYGINQRSQTSKSP